MEARKANEELEELEQELEIVKVLVAQRLQDRRDGIPGPALIANGIPVAFPFSVPPPTNGSAAHLEPPPNNFAFNPQTQGTTSPHLLIPTYSLRLNISQSRTSFSFFALNS